ncbi:hypothetical protein JXQ70_10885 [bacterium]|nr:hypothetical protein [bacterium]
MLIIATYWTIGRCIVEFEQGGESRAQYGAQVMELLASDLTSRFGRGFSATNLRHMRAFFLAYPSSVDHDTIQQTLSAESSFIIISKAFPMSWSHYVRLLPYALEGLPNQVIAAEYRMVLPDEAVLAAELERTHKLLEQRKK